MKGRVVWVVDGDTIHVRVGSRLEKVRYIGVNAPEIPHPEARGWLEGGAQALEVNRQLVVSQATAGYRPTHKLGGPQAGLKLRLLVEGNS